MIHTSNRGQAFHGVKLADEAPHGQEGVREHFRHSQDPQRQDPCEETQDHSDAIDCTLSSVASSLRGAKRNKIISALLMLLSLTLSGCMGVTRLPARVRTPQGLQKPLDISFLQTGQTTRAEVIEKLKLIDTGFQSDRFFLGRWNSSKWGGWVFGIGLGTSAGGAVRFWHDVNLLVEFDEKGAVKSYLTFPDQQLIEKLTAVAGGRGKPSAESGEIELQWMKGGYVGAPRTAKLVLSPNSMEFVETGGAGRLYHFKVPATQFVNIGTATGAGNVSDPVYTTQVLHFSSDLKQAGGPRGKKLYLRVTVPELVMLLSYLSQHTPPLGIPNSDSNGGQECR
jgi:hypothetical protein